MHSNCSGPEARAQGVSRSLGRPGQKDNEQEELVDELRQVRGRGEGRAHIMKDTIDRSWDLE